MFPFGKLLSLNLGVFNNYIRFNLIDIFPVLSIPFYFLLDKSFNKSVKVVKAIRPFLVVLIFSLALSYPALSISQFLYGSFYLVRLIGYFCFFYLVLICIKNKIFEKEAIYLLLIIVSLMVGIFGWIQYFWFPDLTSLKYIGWDDHLYRLTGTFLDPGFTSIILVLGLMLAVVKLFESKKKQIIFILAVFLFISIAFTYSRAGYIALICGLLSLFLYKKEIKKFQALLLGILFIFVILPRPASEGVRLERLNSIKARIQNYKETIEIFKISPLFGVGFNNLCTYRAKFFGGDPNSHSCGGSDSSILFVLATSGVVGILVFFKTVFTLFKEAENGFYGLALRVCLIALLINSLFINSLFYPWVMGYVSVLLALGLKE